jgi:hypothetical protein
MPVYRTRRKRPVRPKRPYVATPDQVRITRDGDGANIDYAEENVSGVHLVLSSQELASMTDEAILEVHNRCIEAQQALADSFEWIAVEVPPGTRQVKRDRRTGQLVPRGDVLRCHITDRGEGEDGPVAIYIDDEEYSLHEFGEILRMYAGWGMRVAFVPDDEVHEEPAIEVRKPKRGR